MQPTLFCAFDVKSGAIEESGYIKKTGVRKTKAGFAASIYELTNKAHLAILFSSISIERLLSRLDESGGNQMPVAIIRVLEH